MEEIWIIGVGHFGFFAFQRLSKSSKKRHFVLVDEVEESLLRCEGPNFTYEQTNGVDFLKQHLHLNNGPDWIIPVVPVHLAADWLLAHFGPRRLRRITVPPEIESLVPNPIRGPDGNIYVSHAVFRCPDNCAEPRDVCTMTEKPRGQNMFAALGKIQLPSFKPLAIRSHQLGPGIGGYPPKRLFEVMEKVEKAKGHILVSTACRCHGVITGLERL